MPKAIKVIFLGFRSVAIEIGMFFLPILIGICILISAIAFICLILFGVFWMAVVLSNIDLSGDVWLQAKVMKYGPWGAALSASIIIFTIGHAVYTSGLKEIQFREALRKSNGNKQSEDISA